MNLKIYDKKRGEKMKLQIKNPSGRIENEYEDTPFAYYEFISTMFNEYLKIFKLKKRIVNHFDGSFTVTVYHGNGWKSIFDDVKKTDLLNLERMEKAWINSNITK